MSVGAHSAPSSLNRPDAVLAITIDVDWAPDHVIDAVATRLIDAGVRATWFVTHGSPAIDRLRRREDLFELGIHPNFMDGSSHGATVSEVIAHCMAIVPDARVMRTHGLVQSSRLFTEIMRLTSIRIDSSLMLRKHPGLQVVTQPYDGGVLTRVPVWWEDDIEQIAPDPDWEIAAHDGAGLRVLNFHPVHLALNGRTPLAYAKLKRAWPKLSAAPAEAFDALREPGAGPSSTFSRALVAIAARGGGQTLSGLAAAVAMYTVAT